MFLSEFVIAKTTAPEIGSKSPSDALNGLNCVSSKRQESFREF